MQQDQTKQPAKLILIKDLDEYFKKNKASDTQRLNVRVLGKLERLVPKKKINDYIEKNPQTTTKDFWKAMFTDDNQIYDFDEIYGIINYRSHLLLVDATLLLMQHHIKIGDIYFFLGELEEVI
jgi:hypothetical protein